MNALKFAGSNVGLIDAATLLANSQFELPTEVFCSMMDYVEAGLDRNGPSTRLVAEKPSLRFVEQPTVDDMMARPRMFFLTPARHVIPGTVVVRP